MLKHELCKNRYFFKTNLNNYFTLLVPEKLTNSNFEISIVPQTLREKCPNTEFFLVHIFSYSD